MERRNTDYKMRPIKLLIASMRASTNLPIAELIKSNPEGRPVSIYHAGVINESHMPVQYFNDGYELIPNPHDHKYLDYISGLCRQTGIDVILPGDSRILTREQAVQLINQGYRVIRPLSKLSDAVSDKLKLAEMAKKMGINAPTGIVVNNILQFTDAYSKLSQEGKTVCFKPRVGLGGRGFRIIREFDELENLLHGYQGPSINYGTAMDILSKRKSFDDLLVMNYLEGVEYSVDCLSWQGEPLAIVPRRKVEYAQLGSYSVQLLEDKEEIIELCKGLIKEFQLEYISNIQFRYSNDKPYLIEINRRMSGGITLACKSGVNFPYLAVKLAMGEKDFYVKPILNRMVVRKPQEFLLEDI